MKARYSIRTCCGDLVTYVECEVPADCVEPADYDAEKHALKVSGYADQGRCGHCGDESYRARYAGYPVVALNGGVVEGQIVAVDRNALVMALEAVLMAVRGAPDYITCVEFIDKGCFIK